MSSHPVSRITAIDLLRGIVMVLMALDHVRYLFHADAALYNPTNLAATTPAVFLTRWVTHFCGPVFIFLAGLAAFLTIEKKGIAFTSRFLFTRGLLLIALELFVFRLGWDYHYLRPTVDLLIIWVIGVVMLILAAAVWLPQRLVAGIGVFILLTHNLLQGVNIAPESPWYNLWVLAYKGGLLKLDLPFYVIVLWTFIPYTGVIFAGYGAGSLYRSGFLVARRRKTLILTGSAAIMLFIVLRLFNLYGDPAHWSPQKDWLFTLLSFVNTTKYPTSLLYVLMTLGPALLFLAYTEHAQGAAVRFFSTLGRVPLFYFAVHLFLIQALSLGAAALFAGSPAIQQFNLAVVYLAWIAVNAILYPLCVRFGRYKFAHPEKGWLGYL